MALLILNEQAMVLNVRLDADEEYKPSSVETDIKKRVDTLREKMTEIEAKYQEEVKDIMPELKSLRDIVKAVNEERYPNLKESQPEVK